MQVATKTKLQEELPPLLAHDLREELELQEEHLNHCDRTASTSPSDHSRTMTPRRDPW